MISKFSKSLLLALVLGSIFFVSCRKTGGGNIPNSQPDTIQENKKTQPESIVEVAKDGVTLLSFPMPFTDFTKGKDAVASWEKEHGGTLLGDPIDLGENKVYNYAANDPLKLNINRAYMLTPKDTLYIVMAYFKPMLFFAENKKTLRPEFEEMMSRTGWTDLGFSEKEFKFQKENITVGIAYSSKSDEAQISYTSDPNQIRPSGKFISGLKDFPLLNKPFKELTPDNIKTFENQLGYRVFDPNRSNDARLVFTAKTDPKSNFTTVSYQLKSTTSSNGTKLDPNIFVISEGISHDMLQNDPDVHAWFQLNGFSKPTSSTGGFVASNKYYTVLASVQEGKLAMIFTPIQSQEKEASVFYLPRYEFGAWFLLDGPIAKFEQARGMRVSYEGGSTNDPYLVARVPDPAPGQPRLPGVSSIYYYQEYSEDTPPTNIYDYAVVSFDLDFPTDGKEARLQKFLKENGYEFKGEKPYSSEYSLVVYKWYYYNSEKKTLLIVNKNKTSLTQDSKTFFIDATFWKEDEFELSMLRKPGFRKKILAKSALLKKSKRTATHRKWK